MRLIWIICCSCLWFLLGGWELLIFCRLFSLILNIQLPGFSLTQCILFMRGSQEKCPCSHQNHKREGLLYLRFFICPNLFLERFLLSLFLLSETLNIVQSSGVKVSPKRSDSPVQNQVSKLWDFSIQVVQQEFFIRKKNVTMSHMFYFSKLRYEQLLNFCNAFLYFT